MNLLRIRVVGLCELGHVTYCKLAAVPHVDELVMFRNEGVRRVAEVMHCASPHPADEVASIVVEKQ